MLDICAIIVWFFCSLILYELASTVVSLLTSPSAYKLLKYRYDYPNIIFIQ